jgi:hypothetical protein
LYAKSTEFVPQTSFFRFVTCCIEVFIQLIDGMVHAVWPGNRVCRVNTVKTQIVCAFSTCMHMVMVMVMVMLMVKPELPLKASLYPVLKIKSMKAL